MASPYTPPGIAGRNTQQFAEAVDRNVARAFESIYGRTAAEIAAGVTPTNYEYPPYNVLRYGADSTGTDDSSEAFQDAFDAAIAASGTVVIPDGSYKLESQVVVTAGSGTRARVDLMQSRGAVINSHVTGSVDGYDTAGFAFLIDGMADSNWYGFSLDFTNGTAGVVMRCRNQHCYRNNFFGPKVIGGTAASTRETRSKIAWRLTGNESGAGSTDYTIYFNKFFGAHFTIGNVLFDLLKGDGSSSTAQPNAPVLIGPLFENYITAINAPDTDEITVQGAWWQLAPGIAHDNNITSITQSNGTATVTHTAHGYETDDIIIIAGATPSAYNGPKRITVLDDDTYTFTVDDSAASPATGTITATLATCALKGQTQFTRLNGIIDAPGATALPFFLFDGSTDNVLDIIEVTGIAGQLEDDGDGNLQITNQRLEGLRRISDRAHTTDGDRDLDIFGTGSSSHSGNGRSRVRIWNNLGSTRNISVGFKDGTTVSIEAAVTGTDIALGTESGEIARLDDSEEALVLADGKRFGFVNSQTTVGAAGGASALPATPTGYLPIKVGSTEYVIPYYAKS